MWRCSAASSGSSSGSDAAAAAPAAGSVNRRISGFRELTSLYPGVTGRRRHRRRRSDLLRGVVTWSRRRGADRSPEHAGAVAVVQSSQRPPRLGIRPSASPPRWRSRVRTTPPWVTTSTSPSCAGRRSRASAASTRSSTDVVGLVARRAAGPTRGNPGQPVVDLGAGAALPLAGVALAQARVDDRRRGRARTPTSSRGVAGALEVGRVERVDAVDRIGVGRGGGLLYAEVAERRVGLPLPATVGVPDRLAVADEQDAGHRREGSAVASTARTAPTPTSHRGTP